MSNEIKYERRTRTYDYASMSSDARGGAVYGGIAGMQRLVTGELPPPPIADTLGFALVEIEPGRALFEGTPAEWQYNPLGTVHGGWIATVLDSALGCAVHSGLAADIGYTTMDLQVRFLRALTVESGVVRAEGKVVSSGRRVATAEARLFGKVDGKLYATATTSCLIVQVVK